MIVLNVGGGGTRDLPTRYDGWKQVLFDIDPDMKPDIVGNALDLETQVEGNLYDAVFCSHTLEHFYKHDVPKVLAGFLNVLKPDGIADITVPNLQHMLKDMMARDLDIDDIWYRAPGGPVTFHDTLYGWDLAMSNGNLHYAHKCGFTGLSLHVAMAKARHKDARFRDIVVSSDGLNLFAEARK